MIISQEQLFYILHYILIKAITLFAFIKTIF